MRRAVNAVIPMVRRWGKALLRPLEHVIWGGRTRERFLRWLLGRHYQSVFRRQWTYAKSAEDFPHFTDHRPGAFALAVGDGDAAPYTRGFLASEVLRAGDRVLDIGCGDGFFDRGYFAPRCAHVDAIDIEPDAIKQAELMNPAENVTYRVMDAVNEPFPAEAYDVIVWDGALGHFAPETTKTMFEKIHSALADEGVFVGSESLGQEGHDHLQFFADLEQLGAALAETFEHVEARRLEYPIGSGVIREEAYWRCAKHPTRLRDAAWLPLAGR